MFRFLMGFEGLIALIFLILIIYLIARRLRIKKEENFEKRNN